MGPRWKGKGQKLKHLQIQCQLTPYNLPSRIYSLLGNEVSDIGKVAALLLDEQKLGQNSKWASYVGRLPQPSNMHNSIFWSVDELEMIRQCSMYEETIKQKNFIEKEFLIVKQILEKCDIIGRDDDDEDDAEDGMLLDFFFLLQERKRKPYQTQKIRNRNWRHKSKLRDNFLAKKMANLRRVSSPQSLVSLIPQIPHRFPPPLQSFRALLTTGQFLVLFCVSTLQMRFLILISPMKNVKGVYLLGCFIGASKEVILSLI